MSSTRIEASQIARLLPVDALRGLIIVLMALDHANHFVAQKHSAGEMWGGPFPTYTDPLAFVTRLITHLSAPGFFFLMGVGMFLFAHARRKQGWSELAILRFFLMGINLILLSAFARTGEKLRPVLNALAVFGRAPLFFYTLYLFLYAALGWLFTPRGTSIPAMIPFWLLGLLILYPLCLWFGRLKQRQPAVSILRLF